MLKPVEVASLLEKAKENNSIKDIAEFLELKSVDSGRTMVSRTVRLFEKLHPKLHTKVDYKSHSAKKEDRDKDLIGFQSGVELARFPLEKQLEVYKLIIDNDLAKEDIKSLISATLKGNQSLNIALEEILEQKGQSKYPILANSISLKEISPNIYTQNEKGRNKIFQEVIINLFPEKSFEEIYLGSQTYLIKFSDTNFTISLKAEQELDKQIKQKLTDYE